MQVSGSYVDKFIIVAMAGVGLLVVVDYSVTYYALHSNPELYEKGLFASWALSHGSIGWYVIGLFDFFMLLLSSAVAVFCYRRCKTLLFPLIAFVPLYLSEIYAVSNNIMWLTTGSP